MNKHFSEIDLLFSNLERQITNINLKYDRLIDYGGCGTFSYALSNVLVDNNVPHELVYVEGPGSPRCDLKFTHILVKVEDTLIDNHGFWKKGLYHPTYSLSKYKLGKMLEDKQIWNDKFPHEKWTDLTQDILSISL
jgi:hypothetical protein